MDALPKAILEGLQGLFQGAERINPGNLLLCAVPFIPNGERGFPISAKATAQGFEAIEEHLGTLHGQIQRVDMNPGASGLPLDLRRRQSRGGGGDRQQPQSGFGVKRFSSRGGGVDRQRAKQAGRQERPENPTTGPVVFSHR
jgi:hypothetical protein